jgi:hypothetical protein
VLTVLETRPQVEWYVENRRNQIGSSAVLALTATAAYACQELSLPYLKLEEHCQYARRFSEYEQILRDFIEWETWLDNWAQHNVEEFRGTGFRPANAVTFLLQFLLSEIWATTTNLREFLTATKPNKVVYWSPQRIQVPWWLHPNVTPATVLLKNAVTEDIELVDLSHELPALSPQPPVLLTLPLRARVPGWIKAYLRESSLFSKIETIQRFGLKPFLARPKGNDARILVSGSGYDLEPVILQLFASGARVSRLRDNLSSVESGPALKSVSQSLHNQLVDAWPKLSEEPRLWQPLNKWKISKTELLSSTLHFWWRNTVPVLWHRYQQVTHSIERKRITALVTVDAGATTWGGPSCQAAFASGVPRFIFQHGGTIGADACIWQTFLRSSDAFLAWGEGVTEDLERTCPPFFTDSGRVVSVGAGRLDRLRRRNSTRSVKKVREVLQRGDPRPIIMYVPTIFGTYGRAISDIAGLPDVSYLELLQNVLGLWKETPGVRLLYKDFAVVNDWTRVVPHFINAKIPNGTVTRHRLSDLAWAVDAIVLDHPLTALSEVLLTSKPLVVYVPKPHKSSPETIALLRKRATVAETQEEFINAVKRLLRLRDFSEVPMPNDEVLCKYGTHTNDGCSAARAAKVILDWPGVVRNAKAIAGAESHPTLRQSNKPSTSDT